MKKMACLVVATIVSAGVVVSEDAFAGSRRPRVSITRPRRDGDLVRQRTELQGRASDDRRVRRIMVSIDGGRRLRAKCRCVGHRVRWRHVLPRVRRGRHEVRVTAVDSGGRRRSITRTYRVRSAFGSGDSSEAYRAFTNDSWWNVPMPAAAPVDPDSSRWMDDLASATRDNRLKLGGAPGTSQTWAQPVYFSQETDPVFTIRPRSGPTVTVHIPADATASGASAPKMTVIDRSTDQGVGLFGAKYSNGQWTSTGVDRYFLSSNGLDEDFGGAPGNTGHRGVTMVTKAPRINEVQAGVIAHRTQCHVPPSIIGVQHVWPMTGSDGDDPGGIPQGIVLRIRPSVDLVARGLSNGALVIARSLQDYGCVITDGGASEAATLMVELGDWSGTGVDKDSLRALTWDDWEFVEGGYRP